MFSENLDVYLRDFGVQCSANGVGFIGIHDMPDEALTLAGVNVLSTMFTLLVKTSDVQAAAIASGVTVTVAGSVHVVRDSLLQDDGAFTSLTLSK